jgi:hypothetical protein
MVAMGVSQSKSCLGNNIIVAREPLEVNRVTRDGGILFGRTLSRDLFEIRIPRV